MSETPAEYRVPGRPGVKQWQVDKACDDLLMRGERPTIEKVRGDIGGSPNSLLPMVDDWWKRLGKRVERGPAAFERLPGTLGLHAEAFFLAALEQARTMARAEEQDLRDTAAKHEEQLSVRAHVLSLREKELVEKLDQHERSRAVLEEELRDKRTLLEKTLATKDALQRQVDELRIVVATLQAKHAAALATPRIRPARTTRTKPAPPARKARSATRRKQKLKRVVRSHRGRR